MSEIKLRPYQEKFISDIRKEFKHNQRRVVGVAPCGAGKTIITGWMIRQAQLNGKAVVFFVHRKELIEQTSLTFSRLHIPHGVIAGGVKPNYNLPVQIASVQTLINRLHLINPPDFLVCDECHHILAKSYKDIIAYWGNAFLLGVTATPLRLGGKTLADVFTSLVQAPTVTELIKLGNLTHFDYFKIPFQLNLKNIKVINGDYQVGGLSKAMNTPIVTDAIFHGYADNANGKSAICYCVDVAHSKAVAEYFNRQGIPTAHCDGETNKVERARIVEDFRQGRYKVLCNAELFGEGFDVPNCHAVILARPTKSLTLHIQQSMRPMRPDPTDPNKVAIIIDCVDNYKQHGYPDTPRNWSLDPNIITSPGTPPTKICPYCKAEIPISAEYCPRCGKQLIYPPELQPLGDAEIVHSSDIAKVEQIQTVIHSPTFLQNFNDFSKIAAERNYKKGWVAFQMLRFVKSFDDLIFLRENCNFKKGWEYHQAKELNIPLKRVAKKPFIG